MHAALSGLLAFVPSASPHFSWLSCKFISNFLV